MARLHVEASAQWRGGTAQFTGRPMSLAVSVSDEAGLPVLGLEKSRFVVRYLLAASTESEASATSDFAEHLSGGPVGLGGITPLSSSPPRRRESFLKTRCSCSSLFVAGAIKDRRYALRGITSSPTSPARARRRTLSARSARGSMPEACRSGRLASRWQVGTGPREQRRAAMVSGYAVGYARLRFPAVFRPSRFAPSCGIRSTMRCRWARLDSNQGPTDYELKSAVSVDLGRSEDSPLIGGNRGRGRPTRLGASRPGSYHFVATAAHRCELVDQVVLDGHLSELCNATEPSGSI